MCIRDRNSDEAMLARLDFLFSSNFQMEGQTMIGIFAASFVSVFLFLLATLWMGMSLWGTILIPVLPFFRGFGLGVSSGFLYASYGLSLIHIYKFKFLTMVDYHQVIQREY